MDYEIVWTEPATEALQEITTYIAQNAPSAARRVADDILERVELLKTVPLIGAAYPRGAQGSTTRVVVCGKYRIFYRVIEGLKRVEILTVWHSSRREPDLPSDASA